MKIVCLGDSFTVGPMIDPHRRWTALLQEETSAAFINRGISGDTTSGMLARLIPDCVDQWPDYAILAGGANDLICCGDQAIVKNNYMAMIHHLFHYEVKPIIVLPIPCVSEMIPDLWKGYRDFSALNDEFAALNEWSIGFSKSFMCQRIDLFTPMMEALTDPDFSRTVYLDGMHLSESGHRFVADLIREQIRGILR